MSSASFHCAGCLSHPYCGFWVGSAVQVGFFWGAVCNFSAPTPKPGHGQELGLSYFFTVQKRRWEGAHIERLEVGGGGATSVPSKQNKK